MKSKLIHDERDTWEYGCYVSDENIDYIASRIMYMLSFGRRMTLIRHIGETPDTCDLLTGLTLSEDSRKPVNYVPGKFVHVDLSPGIAGFGVSSYDYKTLKDVHERRRHVQNLRDEGMNYIKEPVSTYVWIEGGVPGSGVGNRDRILITEINEHGVKISTKVLFDTDWLHVDLSKPETRLRADESGERWRSRILEHTPDHVRWALLSEMLEKSESLEQVHEHLAALREKHDLP